MFVFRNEVSEPKVWFRLAQLRVEGRGQGGSGGTQLSRGFDQFLMFYVGAIFFLKT